MHLVDRRLLVFYVLRDFKGGKLESDIFRLLNLDFWTFTTVKELMFIEANLCKNSYFRGY